MSAYTIFPEFSKNPKGRVVKSFENIHLVCYITLDGRHDFCIEEKVSVRKNMGMIPLVKAEDIFDRTIEGVE